MKASALVLCAAVAVSCTKRNPDFCDDSSQCTDSDAPYCDVAGDYGDANRCISEPAAPDASPGADADVGAPDAYVGPPMVAVSKTGTGAGSVVSAPAGIDCGDTCSAEFGSGTDVTLSASPTAGSLLVTWGGACSRGFDDCAVHVTGGHQVTAHFALEGEHVWSRAIGGAGSDVGVDVAIDPSGNTIVTGSISGSVDFGDGNPVVPSGQEAFVAKYTDELQLEWVWHAPATSRAVAVDQAGDVYFAGETATGLILTKLRASDGVSGWTEEVPGQTTVGGLAVGGGRLVVVGAFEGTIDFGAGDLFAGKKDLFIAWYTPAGDFLRAFDFGGTEDDVAVAVDVDDVGNAVVGGIISTPLSFGGATLPVTGVYAAFVVKFSPSGTHVWSTSMASDTGFAAATTVAFGDGGDVFAGGLFTGNADFGDGPASAGAVSAMFLVRYGSGDGAYRWAVARQALGEYCTMILCLPSRVIPRELAVDPRGRVVVGGEFIGSANFGGGAQASYGGTDVFLATYDASDGAHIRSPVYGRMEEPATAQFNLTTKMLGVDDVGNVVITGKLVGNLGFGGPVLMPDGNDAFLVKFGP